MLIVCFSSVSNAQQLIGGASKPRMRLRTAIVGSTYCTSSNLRLDLQLAFQNTGIVPLLLRKDGFYIGRYLVRRNLGARRKGKRKVDARLEISGDFVIRNMLQDRAFDESPFVRLSPGADHIVQNEIHITSIDDHADPNSLQPGNYLLQVLVSTWLDTPSTATRFQKEHKSAGYLWTKSVMSEPIPFTISEERAIRGCN